MEAYGSLWNPIEVALSATNKSVIVFTVYLQLFCVSYHIIAAHSTTLYLMSFSVIGVVRPYVPQSCHIFLKIYYLAVTINQI